MRRHLPRATLLFAILLVLVGVFGLRAVSDLEDRVEARFQGRLFAVPSRVYSRPLELRPGTDIERIRLRERLDRMGYLVAVSAKRPLRPGEYRKSAELLEIYRRAVRLPDRNDPARLFALRLTGTRIAAVRDPAGDLLASATLEPEIIAQFHGVERADRRLEALADVPPALVDAIISVEDQSFFEHSGIHVWRIAGAMLANLRARRVVQGGSTLTQQLAKNFYLTHERTLTRKATEALMALLLERNHTKREILEAYLNEVYMGQRGSVAIHGVGEASQHYFGKRVGELTLPEAALLAGMIKGPNLYSPYKHPEAARKRRDLVLSVLREQNRIDRDAYESAADRGSRRARRVRGRARRAVLRRGAASGAFGEIRRRDPAERGDGDLLDARQPSCSVRPTRRSRRGLERLEKDYPKLRRPESPLQAAVVALSPRSGEVLALVGGRDYKRSQFNRATQALRQPGSVFKPIVLLAAVGRSAGAARFTLLSKLEDEQFTLKLPSGTWKPVNYDGEYHGTVTVARGDREVAERSDREARHRGRSRADRRDGAATRHQEPARARAERLARIVRGHGSGGRTGLLGARGGGLVADVALLHRCGSRGRTRARGASSRGRDGIRPGRGLPGHLRAARESSTAAPGRRCERWDSAATSPARRARAPTTATPGSSATRPRS